MAQSGRWSGTGKLRGGRWGIWFFITALRALGLRATYVLSVPVAIYYLTTLLRGAKGAQVWHVDLKFFCTFCGSVAKLSVNNRKVTTQLVILPGENYKKKMYLYH